MTLAEIEELDERTALVWDGAPSRKPLTWAEAEAIALTMMAAGAGSSAGASGATGVGS
ncbi:hypothetical protein UFOVP1236_20 [uncultured Caudovirales phage]|uniref:Uncharacterized protein n=1 Tax=uncultured Caudovirales phage TaxID=2100421 RepID=A0A6J5R934_9CAUD|nr:hypothetical protein UFOVP1236_20 [uncultured Caudovirales phage]